MRGDQLCSVGGSGGVEIACKTATDAGQFIEQIAVGGRSGAVGEKPCGTQGTTDKSKKFHFVADVAIGQEDHVADCPVGHRWGERLKNARGHHGSAAAIQAVEVGQAKRNIDRRCGKGID